MSDEPKLHIPERVSRALDDLLGALKKHAKGDLVAVIAHGSATRGDFKEGSSDVDLVVVLADDRIALIEALGQPLIVARNTARIEAMILVKGELAASADVFPLLFGDIAHDGVVLFGESPFDSITIHEDHKRLRIEQELREANIRLRLAVADVAGGLLRLEGVLDRKLKKLRSPLRALLERAGKPPKDKSVAGVVAAAGLLLGVDTAPLAHPQKDAQAALPAVVALLAAAIEHIDRVEEGA